MPLMLNLRDGTGQDLSHPLFRIKTLSSKIEQKIVQKDKGAEDGFIETLSVEELKDLRQVILASEYLLTKYQDKKEIKTFLEEFIGIIMHATNSVNVLRDELEDLVISAEVALQQIHTLHDDVTRNLAFGRESQTRLDDFRASRVPVVPALAEPANVLPAVEQPSSINLTNPTRRVHTSDYLTRTEVEI
ncbi:MAG: hypothetical protein ACREBI_05275 [Nitrosotalea sp.]